MSAESIAKALVDPTGEPEEVMAIAELPERQTRMTQSPSNTT